MAEENHKYLCWLSEIKGIGRQHKHRLLHAAAGGDLFSESLQEDSGDRPAEGRPAEGRQAEGRPAEGRPAEERLSEERPIEDRLKEDRQPEAGSEGAVRLYKASETELRFLCAEAGFVRKRDFEQAVQLLMRAKKQEPAGIEEDLERRGISFTGFSEEGFPERLREIPDPPFGLYCRGNMPPANAVEPAAAVIGARLASGYGREQARRFSRRLASRGIVVISGMARGIDGIAQKAALDAGGRSYAILGCGVDLCYPEENRALYEQLLQEGGVLSEFPPGTPPDGKNFPQRNRIISGLSDLVLVIEARRRSGTLITVDMALEQGREVFALPGRVSDALSDGCNRLIRQGAGVASCPEDVLDFFYGTGSGDGRADVRKTHAGYPYRGMAGPESGSADPHGQEAGSDTADAKIHTLEVDTAVLNSGNKVFPQTGADRTAAERPKQKTDERSDGKPLSLEHRILSVLTAEDETHIEQILEKLECENPGQEIETDSGQKKAEGEKVSLSALTVCLLRLKLDGRIEETASGYYRKTGRD